MGVSSCTGPKEWKGVADCNAGGGLTQTANLDTFS